MHPSIRGSGIARGPFALLTGILATAIVAAGCGNQQPTASTTPAPTLASPASSQRLPTPVPTPVGPSAEPSAAASPAPAGLLLRLTTCSHTCESTPGTTFLDDGRMLWEAVDGSGQVLMAQLTEDGMATVRAAIEATPSLATDGDYRATLKPGAEPIPHGLNLFRFAVEWAGGPVLVTSWDPASLADQADRWTFPPEMAELAPLAARLLDPVAWLGEGAFLGPPVPYSPEGVLVRIDLYPDLGALGAGPDVDDVDWPFEQPIERAGEPLPGEDTPRPRCVILDEVGGLNLRAAEFAAGVNRDLRLWETVKEYDWERADGFVQVTVRQLLPHEPGDCTAMADGAP
jgi:hypothetical protein